MRQPTVDVTHERQQRKEKLAAAFRLFAHFGYEEGVAGHITVRDPEKPDHFWVNPFGVHFGHIRVRDLILVNHQGEVVEGNMPVNGAAFAIHSRIHIARPDVIAAAHAHSMYGKTWSTLGRLLDPLTQDACAFYEDHGLFQDYTGVVFDTGEGDRIAQALGHPAAPIDDLLVFHVAFGKTVPDISWNAVANLGYADARFLVPVYAGDTLRCESEIIGLKQNSNGKNGVVYVRSSAFNQHEVMVLTWARWVMVLNKDVNVSAPDAVLPMLPRSVAAESLAVPAFLQPRGLTAAMTGSPRCWDDYRVNEVIDHPPA